jgi:hypothetical protein
MGYEITVHARGPIFDGTSGPARSRAIHEGVQEVARRAKTEWLTNLDRSIRHQTPYYTTKVTTEDVGYFEERVWDDNVIYGPWLEGVGSRNATTRFKGYASLRRAHQEVDRLAPELMERAIERRIWEIG